MHVSKLEDGTYKVTIEAPRDPSTGKRKQITRRHKIKREAIKRAEAEYDKRVERFGAWGHLDTNKYTFRKVAEMFLEEYKQKEKISTYYSRVTNMNKVYEYFDQIEIGKINHKQVQSMVDDMMLGNKKYSQHYAQSVKGSFNLVMSYAIKNGIIDINPGLGIKYPKTLVTVEELEREDVYDHVLTKKNIRDILTVFKSDRYRFKDSYELFLLMYYTGLRPGEAMALKIKDIDFKKQVIKVTKTLFNPDEKKRGHTLIPPKNNKARIVSFSNELNQPLKELIERKKQTKKIFGNAYIDENFLFCDQYGDPYKHGVSSKRFRKACEAANIDLKKQHFRPHSFRHAHVTMLVQAGVDVKVAQERLGHKNINTTLGVYTHVTEKMKKDTVTKIDDHIGNALNLTLKKIRLRNRGQAVVKLLYYK